jgi:hypothetical protein
VFGRSTPHVLARAFSASVLACIAFACGYDDITPATTNDGGTPEASASDASPPREGGGTPFTEAAMRAASNAYLSVWCPAAEELAKTWFDYQYESQAACLDQNASVEELSTWFPYGSTLTPDKLITCANKLPAIVSTLAGLLAYSFEQNVPDECHDVAYGSLPIGETCSIYGIGVAPLWNQCASGRCIGQPCGHCIPALDAGQECARPGDCPAGMTCAGPTSGTATCVSLLDVGADCDSSADPFAGTAGTKVCHSHLLCVNNKCAEPPADGSCDPAVGCAHFPSQRYCNPATNKCESALVPLGAACGYNALPGGNFAWCAHSRCARIRGIPDGGALDDASDDASYDGGDGGDGGLADSGAIVTGYVCVPPLPDGEACSQADYPNGACQSGPLRTSDCINGRCAYYGASVCSAPVVAP